MLASQLFCREIGWNVKRNLKKTGLRTWERSCATVLRSSISKIHEEESSVSLRFGNAAEHKYHYMWLRDHCLCDHCYNPVTQQRQFQTVKIPFDIQPQEIEAKDGKLVVRCMSFVCDAELKKL